VGTVLESFAEALDVRVQVKYLPLDPGRPADSRCSMLTPDGNRKQRAVLCATV